MGVKLDIKDRKLLFYLAQDARTSDTQLAKRVGLSKNAIKYRTMRLQKRNIIRKFTSIINIGALGYETCVLLIKCTEDIYEHTTLLQYIKDYPFSNWVATMSGNWDLLVEFVYTDIQHIYEIMNDLLTTFGSLINTYQLSISGQAIKVEPLPATISEDLEVEHALTTKRTKMRYHLDVLDREILSICSKEAQLPLHAIALRMKTSVDSVRKRLKKCKDARLLIKHTIDVNLEELGYTQYFVVLQVKHMAAATLKDITNNIAMSKNITYAYFDILSAQFVCIFASKATSDLELFLRILRKSSGMSIDKQDTFMIKETLKFDLFPDGLLTPPTHIAVPL